MSEIKKIAIQCFQDEAQALLDLIPQLTDDFDKAVKIISLCKGKVIITGVGKSGHIGAKIAATLASTGTPSFFVNPLDAFHGDLGMITSDDIVLAISNSGQTDELLRFIPFMKERNIPLIGMSGNNRSLLAEYSDCHLNIAVKREACPLNLAPTSSTTATLAMGDALACALIKIKNFQPKDFAQYHPGGSLGRRLLTKVRDVMRTDNLPMATKEEIISDVFVRISEGRLGLVVIVSTKGKLLGIVTDGDIRRAFQKYRAESFDIKMKDIMTKTPVNILEDSKLVAADHLFKEKSVNSIIVVNAQKQFMGVLESNKCHL